MMKTIYLLAFTVITLATFSIITDNKSTNGCAISGKIIENLSSDVIENALVTVSDNGKIIAQTSVKEDGSFYFEKLPNSKVQITIENIAYQTINKTIDLVHASDFNFGTISLVPHVNILEELIINVKRR